MRYCPLNYWRFCFAARYFLLRKDFKLDGNLLNLLSCLIRPKEELIIIKYPKTWYNYFLLKDFRIDLGSCYWIRKSLIIVSGNWICALDSNFCVAYSLLFVIHLHTTFYSPSFSFLAYTFDSRTSVNSSLD